MLTRKDFDTIINDAERFKKLKEVSKSITEETKELTKDEFMEFLDKTTKEEVIRYTVIMIIICAIALASTKWLFLTYIYILIKAYLFNFGMDFIRYCAEDGYYEFRSDEDNGAEGETVNRS